MQEEEAHTLRRGGISLEESVMQINPQELTITLLQLRRLGKLGEREPVVGIEDISCLKSVFFTG